ncbi:MAG: helix-turn-helix transcriptional regulator [Ruminococcaceae bacterium]|nr:helix-turn-helix transcriptional regulator [Oscillospiraceae bacterium]
MTNSSNITIIGPLVIVISLLVISVLCYLIYLCIKALKKYIRTKPIREEKAENTKTLAVILKEYRIKCNMTQEFVAESLGVSRQAVSKWETGSSEPSTSNLIAISKLYNVSAEEILKEIIK